MKILLCHNLYKEAGGGENVAVASLKKLLENKGHRVALYVQNNNEIQEYSIWGKISFFPDAIFSWKTYKNIKRIIKTERPDVAHIHNTFPLISPSVYFVLREMEVPVIQTIHNFRFLCPNGYFYRSHQICERCKNGNYLNAVIRRCYRDSYPLSFLYAITIWLHRKLKTFRNKIDITICPSNFVASKLMERVVSTKKVVVLPYFVDVDLEPNYDFERKAVFLGRLCEEKGLFTLVEAFRGTKSIDLEIMGHGPLAEKLKDYVHENNIKNVKLLGFVKGKKRFEILSKAMFSIVPSEWYENLPISVLESFALGVPVVAARIGALAELVEDGKNGLLFEVGNSEDLRRRIRYLADNPDKTVEMGKYARYCVETKYNAEVHYEKLMQVYEKAIQEHKKAR